MLDVQPSGRTFSAWQKREEAPKAGGFDDVLKRMLSTPPQVDTESVKPVKKPKPAVDRPKPKD
jgi:hypothetical protein